MRYSLKVLCSRYNSFAGTETLSLSVYEPFAIKLWLEDRPANFGGRSKVRGPSAVPRESHHTGHNLLIETDTLSLSV